MTKKRTLTELTAELVSLRDSHGLKKVHSPKDLALALTVEVGDILAHFQWKQDAEIRAFLKESKSDLGEELVVALNYILLMSHDFGLDIEAILDDKIKKGSMKYPEKKQKIVRTTI